MLNVVTNELMRRLDRHMMDDVGIPGIVLMENAARRCAEAAVNCGKSGSVAVLIGPGNNGGDGFAVLRILKTLGREAFGVLVSDPEKLTGDALTNYIAAKNLDLTMTDDLTSIGTASVIVDALFGTGLCRELSGRFLEAIKLANAADAYRIAIDIPSGINGDTGEVMGGCFAADETVTMLALKRGLLLTNRLESVGRITVAPIGLVRDEYAGLLQNEQLIDEAFVREMLPKRRRVSNKGSYGKALITAGSPNMSGAAVMAASAALRGGAGLTKAFVPESIIPAFACLPEVMVLGDKGNSLSDAVDWADAVGCGCGMGNDPRIREKVETVLKCGKPAVLDADALNLMSREHDLLKQLCANHILTPHPAEMARLTGKQTSEVLSDPVDTASSFARKHGCIVLLKNAVSVIASPDGRLRYNATGSPALSKGGSGDTLTGIITALLAQGLGAFDAASCGAYLLGVSAQKAVELLNERFVCASDLTQALSMLLDTDLKNGESDD